MAELAAAMVRLADDPDLCSSMGRAAQLSVEEHFDWDRKGEFMAQVYEMRYERGTQRKTQSPSTGWTC